MEIQFKWKDVNKNFCLVATAKKFAIKILV